MILNITGNVAVLVFLAMNSLLCWLMQYTKIQIGIAASIAKYEDRIDELKDDDVSFEDAFNEYMENVNLDDADTYTPKLITYVANISLAICFIGIIVGITRLV